MKINSGRIERPKRDYIRDIHAAVCDHKAISWMGGYPKTGSYFQFARYPSLRLAFGKTKGSRKGAMAENKTNPTKLSVAAFIETITDSTRRADAKTLVKLMQNAAGEKPKMWGPSIIGFGSYHYKYDSGREGDMLLIGFSPRKAATVLYGLIGSSDSKDLLPKLGKHSTGKGCLYIKTLADVDQQVLETMVVKSLAAMRARKPS